MTTAVQPSTPRTDAPTPASFLAAAAALAATDDALRGAQHETLDASAPDPAQAPASLVLLRQVREQLAGWETGLIETARNVGASWADLAGPLGVASRQAAERRYLRGRPGAVGTTGERRVMATRQARVAERATATWARATPPTCAASPGKSARSATSHPQRAQPRPPTMPLSAPPTPPSSSPRPTFAPTSMPATPTSSNLDTVEDRRTTTAGASHD